ncbi:unnamed protein product [Phytomonas sp. Hart1]|nr:unnamed protein product [Phytomonas sp. Hart1]|eukprot:CCW67983.1 unnamed protein product [Phytomonas sp. isolate Hart1]
MPADPYTYAEITQIDVAIVMHFLKGTEAISEEKLVDELFELKPFITSLGSSEVENIIKKCREEKNHGNVISYLKNAEVENRKKSKQNFFNWIFKKKKEDKEACSLPDKGKEKRNQTSCEDVEEKEIIPSLKTPELSSPSSNGNNMECYPKMSINSTDSQSTSSRTAPLLFQTRLQRHEEYELSNRYNFQNTSNNTALLNSSEATPQIDKEFQEIFRKFVNNFSDS